MPRLRDRNKQIPNSLRFYQAQTNWKSRPWASFNEIVQSLIKHRLGNPGLTKQHGWATDVKAVEAEVDAFNAKLCVDNGWTNFIAEGGDDSLLPKSSAPLSLRRRLANAVGGARKLGSGAELLVEWIESGEEAVATHVAEVRAGVCAGCQFNSDKAFASMFTEPVSRAIKGKMAKRSMWNLETTHDEKLGTCSLCLCPLALKVFTPIEFIRNHIDEDTKAEMTAKAGGWCWVVKELKESQ